MRLLPLLVLFAIAFTQSPKQHAGNKQNAQDQVNKPSDNQSVPDTMKSPEAQAYTYYEQKPEGNEIEKEIKDYSLLAFTLALAIVGYLQWRVLKEHEGWMQKHDAKLETLSKATENSATAAKDSFQSVIDSERAWVVADAPMVHSDIASGQPIDVSCTVRNRGKTMARVIQKGENFSVQASPEGLFPTPDYGTPMVWPNGVVLSPASESVLTRRLRIDNGTWGNITIGAMTLFVFGYVKYLDVFDRKHETRYIFRYDIAPSNSTRFYVEYRPEYTQTT